MNKRMTLCDITSQPYHNKKMALCDWCNKSAISRQENGIVWWSKQQNGIVCLKFQDKFDLKWLQAIKYEQNNDVCHWRICQNNNDICHNSMMKKNNIQVKGNLNMYDIPFWIWDRQQLINILWVYYAIVTISEWLIKELCRNAK